MKAVSLIFVVGLLVRTFFFQTFHVSSSSMEPTLMEGDYLVTSKHTVGYGYYSLRPFRIKTRDGRWLSSEPKRGDIIVFKATEEERTYVKRLIGFPGDNVQMKGGVLHLNGQPFDTMPTGMTERVDQMGIPLTVEVWREAMPSGRDYEVYDRIKQSGSDDTEIFHVPEDHYFFMGDNRDMSGDSRTVIGYVPTTHIIGKAEFVFMSTGQDFSFFRPWTWTHVRRDRTLKAVN